jgi:predicted transposase YdaD
MELSANEELKLQREIDTSSQNDQEKIMRMLLPGERAGLRKGRQEGRQEMLREGILDILEARFQDGPYALREKIQEIPQETRLKTLHHQAVSVESLEAFAKRL